MIAAPDQRPRPGHLQALAAPPEARVLVVHDDRRMLADLQRALYRDLPGWTVEVAANATGGLAALNRSSFDALVSDASVAGPRGAPFLNVVRRRWPTLPQIAVRDLVSAPHGFGSCLSGDQLLQVPPLWEALTDALVRGCALRSITDNPAAREIVDRLWPLVGGGPGVQLVQVFAWDGETAAPPTPLPVEHPLQGTVEAILAIAGLPLDLLQQRALLAGRIVRRLIPAAQAQQAFAAAFLADIGTFALALAMPGRFALAARIVARPGRAAPSERQSFGATHAEVGAHLLARCGLPPSIVEAVAFHHRPAGLPVRGLEPVVAVHAAVVLMDEILGPLPGPVGEQASLDVGLLEQLGLKGRLPQWRRIAEQEAFLPQSV